MTSKKSGTKRPSTNPFDDSSEDGIVSLDDDFHDCHENEELMPRSSQKRSAPLNFHQDSEERPPSQPALQFENESEGLQNDFFSPLEAALLTFSNESNDLISPSSAENQDLDSDVDETDNTHHDVKETKWSKLLLVASPFAEKVNAINRGDQVNMHASFSSDDLDRSMHSRTSSQGSFLSAKSQHSDFLAFEPEEPWTPPSRQGSLLKKSPGSSLKKRKPTVLAKALFNPVLERLENSPNESQLTMDYKSPDSPWTHLILLEDLGTASSWAVLIIPYVAFVLCLALDANPALLVHEVGPLSAQNQCASASSSGTGYSVPLIPTPVDPCRFQFSLSDRSGVLSYGGKGYATVQEHYQSLMPNGTAFSSGPLSHVPPMSTFLRGDVRFTNVTTQMVSLVAQGRIAFSTVVSQKKTDNEWVPVSMSSPSRLSMTCTHFGSEKELDSSLWNCTSPRVLDVLFSLPGTAILVGTDVEVNILYSYFNRTSSSESISFEYFTSSISETKANDFSYVYTDSLSLTRQLLNRSTSNQDALVNDLVRSSDYVIERQRTVYGKVDVYVRLLLSVVTVAFLVFWCFSMGYKGFCGVWGEADGGCCRNPFGFMRRRNNSEDLPFVRQTNRGLLWWQSPWLLFPERRYLLLLLICLLLVQNTLLVYVYFFPYLYGSKRIHAAADACVGIGVHGILMLWLCLFCGLRYHTAAVTRQRAKQQKELMELRRTAKYVRKGDSCLYGTEDSISQYTAEYFDKYGDVYGSGTVSHLRMKHDPCGDSWPDFLLPKVFIFLLGASSVLITAVCRFPAEGDTAATMSPSLLRQYNSMYVLSSSFQLVILITWVFLIVRNAYLTGAKLRKEPFLSTRPAQLAFRVMSSMLFLGIGALAVPIVMDAVNLIKKWSMPNAARKPIPTTLSTSALDVLLRVLFHITQRFPYSGTASSIGPGKILYATTCGLVTAFIFLPSRTFFEEGTEATRIEQRKELFDEKNIFQKALTDKIRQRRDKRSVVTLARYAHTWRVFPLPIKKIGGPSDLLAGGSFFVNKKMDICRIPRSADRGIVYVGSYMPVFCVELACWLLEASWQSYYSPSEYSVNDFAPGRMSLRTIGLQLDTSIYDESTETQAIVATNIIPQVDGEEDSIIVIAFRGTTTSRNLKTDLKFQQVPLPGEIMSFDRQAAFQIHENRILAENHCGWDDWIGSSANDEIESSLRCYSPRKKKSSGQFLDIQWLAQRPTTLAAMSSGAKAVLRATPVARQALPCVHEGFIEAYSHIRKQLWESLLTVLQRQFAKCIRRCQDNVEESPLTLPKIYVTGHSLGGSLGQLLALDIASNCELIIEKESLFALPSPERHSSLSLLPDSDEEKGGQSKANFRRTELRLQPAICVYTFGQPRLGNRAFARLYKKRVPHTFRVSNEGDAFTTMPKFTVCGGLYKHAGLEVMLDEGKTGNILVGPTVVETLFRFTKVRTSVAAHSLGRYRDCLESSLAQDELEEYYRGHGGKGGFSRPLSEVGSTSASNTSLPDWITQRKRSETD